MEKMEKEVPNPNHVNPDHINEDKKLQNATTTTTTILSKKNNNNEKNKLSQEAIPVQKLQPSSNPDEKTTSVLVPKPNHHTTTTKEINSHPSTLSIQENSNQELKKAFIQDKRMKPTESSNSIKVKTEIIPSSVKNIPCSQEQDKTYPTTVTSKLTNLSLINTTTTNTIPTIKATTATTPPSTATITPSLTTTTTTPNESSVTSKSTTTLLPTSLFSLAHTTTPTPVTTQTATPKSTKTSTITSTTTTTSTPITLESLSNLNMDFNDIPKTEHLRSIIPILKSNVAKSCLNLLKETKGKPGRKKKSTTTTINNNQTPTTTTTTSTSTPTNVTVKIEPNTPTDQKSLADGKETIINNKNSSTALPLKEVKPAVTKSLSTPILSQSKDLKSNPSLQKYPVLKPKSQPSNLSGPFVLSLLNKIHGKTPLLPLSHGLDMKKVSTTSSTSSLPSLLHSTIKKSPGSLSSLDKMKEVKKEGIQYTNLNFNHQEFPTTPLCPSPFSLTQSPSLPSINKNLPFPLNQTLFQQMNQKLNALSTPTTTTTIDPSNPTTPSNKPDKKSAYQKRQDRLLKNREAAHLSRKRKREQLHQLEVHAQELISENQQLKEKVIELEKSNISYQDELKDLKEKYAILKNVLMSSSSSTSVKSTNLSQLTLTPPPSETSTPNSKNDDLSTNPTTTTMHSKADLDECTTTPSPNNKKQKTNNILFMIK